MECRLRFPVIVPFVNVKSYLFFTGRSVLSFGLVGLSLKYQFLLKTRFFHMKKKMRTF